MEIDLNKLEYILKKKIEQAIKEAIEEATSKRPEYKIVKEFVEMNNKVYKVVIAPSKSGDKIPVYIYKAGKRLGVIGEIVVRENENLMFYAYDRYIGILSKKEGIDKDELINKIHEIVNNRKDEIRRFIDKGFSIRKYEDLVNPNEEEQDPALIAYKVSAIEDEMERYIKENNLEYVPEDFVRKLLKKNNISINTFAMYVRRFYEKEPGKWYYIG